MKSAAEATADVAPITNHASQAGTEVSKYRSEPIRMNRAADPASEIPSDNKTELAMLTIKSLLILCFKAISVWLANSLKAAFISARTISIISLRDILMDKIFTPKK